MQLTTTAIFAAAALASVVTANSAQFVNKEDVTRQVTFTPSAGQAGIPPLKIPGGGEATAKFPEGWIGNAWSYREGQPAKEGLLAEFRFNGDSGNNFFDVSAVVAPDANDGVMTIEPANSKTPLAGCTTMPCGPEQQYIKFDDDRSTKSTKETDFIVTLGQRTGGGKLRRARRGIDHDYAA